MSIANSSINSFMSNFDGGSRPNLYSVNLSCPILGALPVLQFYCKAATLPSSILGEVNVPYLGRMAKYPGDRQFEDWTIDIINDQGMTLRSAFERWSEAFNTYAGNATAFPNPRAAFGTAVVAQLARDYSVVKWYQFFDVWPDNIASVQLGYDQNDTVSDFQVTFKYSYFVTSSGYPIQAAGLPGSTLGPGGVVAGSAGAPFGTPGFGGIGAGLGSGASVGVFGPNGGVGVGAGGGLNSTSFGINTGSFGFGISTSRVPGT